MKKGRERDQEQEGETRGYHRPIQYLCNSSTAHEISYLTSSHSQLFTAGYLNSNNVRILLNLGKDRSPFLKTPCPRILAYRQSVK